MNVGKRKGDSVMNTNFVIIGQDPNSQDFFFHERADKDGQPGQIVKMGDGKGDITKTVKGLIEEGFDPSKIIINGQPATDLFQKTDNKKDEVKLPEITNYQALSMRFTDDQIEAMNKVGRVPDKLKIVPNNINGGYTLVYDFGKITQGTKEIPAGFEMKRNVLGFAMIVPKGTEGLLIAS